MKDIFKILLASVAGIAVGYILWHKNAKDCPICTDSLDGMLVSEMGDAHSVTYPIYKIKGSTKTALTGKEYEDWLSGGTQVLLVNLEFLNKYTTVGGIETNNK